MSNTSWTKTKNQRTETTAKQWKNTQNGSKSRKFKSARAEQKPNDTATSARTAINQEEAGHEKQAHIARTTGSALSEPQGVDAIVITSSTSFGALA